MPSEHAIVEVLVEDVDEEVDDEEDEVLIVKVDVPEPGLYRLVPAICRFMAPAFVKRVGALHSGMVQYPIHM